MVTYCKEKKGRAMTADIILLLVLIVFVLSGYRKGLILSLCALLILVVSCLGASVAQEVLTPRVTERVVPQVTEVIAQTLTERIHGEDTLTQEQDMGVTIGGQYLGTLMDLLDSLGLPVEESEVETDITTPLVTAAAETMAEVIVNAFAGTVIFLGAFLMIYLLLRTLELGLNMVDRLPVIHTLNHLGGGVIGLVSGALVLVMASALLRGTGVFPETAFSGPVSHLLRSIVEMALG